MFVKSRCQFTHWVLLLLPLLVWTMLPSHAQGQGFLGGLSHVSTVSSTVPANGDVNPYGIVRVPITAGKLRKGSLIVSNFNNVKNLQGTGTTIVQISPTGSMSLFAQIDPTKLPGPCPGGVGLTTALVALRSGFVIVGSLPTADGTSATAQSGCLLVLNSSGKVVRTIVGNHLNGPWDMTAVDGGTLAVLFVTNVLNGTVAASPNIVRQGTVVRLLLAIPTNGIPHVLSSTIIGSGFATRTDPAALVVGPTGVGFDGVHDILYVASSVGNRIAAIPKALIRVTSAGTGTTVSSGGFLNDPLGLTLAPNGNILTANGNDGNIVETTPAGRQIAKRLVDKTGGPPPGAGTLFGLTVVASQGVFFVDDGSNTLNLLHH